jgi:hypothetical protein
MSGGGWIKLHRSITKSFIYTFDEPDKALAWIDLLLMARHDDGKIMLKGQVISISRGQVAMSQYGMEKRWKWSRNKVRRFLLLLENEGKIIVEAKPLTTIVTICNYSEYQDNGTTDGTTDGTANGTSTKLQADTDIRKKERKERKNNGADALFTPPTLGEIRAYMAERGVKDRVEAEKFLDFYTSKGWVVGKTKMKCWRATIRNWVRNSDGGGIKSIGDGTEGMKWIRPAN